MIAEIPAMSFIVSDIDELQWGRDQMIAEIYKTGHGQVRAGCFNGAAIK